MKQISISEEQYITTTNQRRAEMLALAREFAQDAGIDWATEYRWMTLTEENYFLARLKYDLILSAMRVRTI